VPLLKVIAVIELIKHVRLTALKKKI